jgi:hypothetical protein
MSSRPAGAESSETPAPSPTAIHARSGLITPSMTDVDAFVLLATSISAEAVDRVRKLNASAAPEDLHKLRVALRRLRTLRWAYEALLDKKDAKLQRREFKSLADAAGRTRDWDAVLGERASASRVARCRSTHCKFCRRACESGRTGPEKARQASGIGAGLRLRGASRGTDRGEKTALPAAVLFASSGWRSSGCYRPTHRGARRTRNAE